MKKSFFTGLAIFLPVAVTCIVIFWLIHILTQPFMGIVTHFLVHTQLKDVHVGFLSSTQVIYWISQILILVSLGLFILGFGFTARFFLFRKLLQWGERGLKKIPLVQQIYKIFKEVVKTLFSVEKNTFKQVVLIPYPNEESYALGFVSEPFEKDSPFLSVMVPTAPLPSSGFVLMVEKKDVIFMDMKPEEALKYIISCGVAT